MQRAVIIHVHIFKNAGSTLDWSLRRSLGADLYQDIVEDPQNHILNATLLENIITSRPNLKAISSHNIKLPLPQIKDIQLIPVFLIRHPLLRAVSVYEYEQRVSQLSGATSNTSHMILSEYIQHYLKLDQHAIIRNFQTLYCTGTAGDDVVMTQQTCDNAITNLYNTPLVGMVDQYDNSMVVFENTLHQLLPEIDLSYIKQNASHKKTVSNEVALANLKQTIGESLYNALLEHNAYDLQLYNAANKILNERLASISRQKITTYIFRNKTLSFLTDARDNFNRLYLKLVRQFKKDLS